MREASWDDCILYNSAVKVSPNLERAKSLIETSDERVELASKPNERNCNFVFEDYYTSLLELLQALIIVKGYNIINHVCLGYYLRDCMGRDDLFIVFDDIRYKRNSLTYYGKRMDFETAKSAIQRSQQLISQLKAALKKELKSG